MTGALAQRLYEYLVERPAGAVPEELFELVFSQAGRDPEFAPRFLATLLGDDPRFRFDPLERRWRVRLHETLVRPLDDTGFVVVDLETTGGAPGASGITEIGAVRVVGGRLVDSFATLVRPGHRIQPFVTRLTGITDEMVAAAPSIHEALPQFLHFLGEDVLVAHNATFDVGYLNASHELVLGRRLDRPALCTLRLARRLMPAVRRRSLDSVAAHLGIACVDRHRALGDARTAAEILTVFLERVRVRGIVRLDELLDFQHRAADGRPFITHIPRARLDTVPQMPGVYRLLGSDGKLLYIGKARRLRDRLASYFTNARGHAAKTLELIRQVYDFQLAETGSELAASLLEARLIRELRPPFNRQRRHLPRVGYLKLSAQSQFPRLWVTRRLGTDRALYLGPFRSVESAEQAQAAVGRVFKLRTCAGALAPSPTFTPCISGQVGACTAPCAAQVDEDTYRQQVQSFLDYLDGRDDAVRAQLEARRDGLAAELRYEAAGKAQRDADLLETLRRRQRTLSWVVQRQNFVVMLPTVDREAVQFYGVLGGRLVVEARISAAVDLLVPVNLVRERFARYQDHPLGREDVDASTIIAGWLRDRGAQEGILLPLDGSESIIERLDELSVTLRDLGLRGPLPSIDGLS